MDVNECHLITSIQFMSIFLQETFFVYTIVTSDWFLQQLKNNGFKNGCKLN